MKQSIVKFQSKNAIQTYSSMGGIILAEEIFKRLGINHAIDKHIGARRAGSGVKYTDTTYIKSFVLMQMLGGDTVDDLRLLREDPVINTIIGKTPGKTSAHNYLSSFVDKKELGFTIQVEIDDASTKILTIMSTKGWISSFAIDNGKPDFYQVRGKRNTTNKDALSDELL